MMFLHFDLTHLFTFGTGFLFAEKLLMSTSAVLPTGTKDSFINFININFFDWNTGSGRPVLSGLRSAVVPPSSR